MVGISFESNLREWTAALTDFERRQLPFAIARALTETARLDAVPAVEERLVVAFESPTPFTRRGVAYLPARKHEPVATVLIKDVQARYLQIEETGGVRRPKGRALIVPVGQRLNAYGNLPRGSVKRLLARKDVFSGQVRGIGGIWQRKKGGRLKLLVRFHDDAEYKPRFLFAKTVEQVVRSAFPRRFVEALAYAIATAR